MLRHDEPKYLPTKEDIREACERIQAGWSEKERLKRQCVGTVAAHVAVARYFPRRKGNEPT